MCQAISREKIVGKQKFLKLPETYQKICLAAMFYLSLVVSSISLASKDRAIPI